MSLVWTVIWPLACWACVAIWVYIDSRRRRIQRGKWWVIATFFLGAWALCVYIAKRPLKVGETREGGLGWNILKNFALFWTLGVIVTGVAVVATVPSEIDEDERSEVAKLLFGLWFFPMLSAMILGFFLKKSSATESGPTGPLATENAVDYQLIDFARDTRANLQIAAAIMRSGYLALVSKWQAECDVVSPANSQGAVSSSSEIEWYYERNGASVGPLSISALKGLIASRQIPSTTHIWNQDLKNWVSADSVPELRPAPTPPPVQRRPPPPPPPPVRR